MFYRAGIVFLLTAAVLQLSAAELPSLIPDVSKASFTGPATAVDTGVRLDLDMGTKRGNWNRAKWAQHIFPEVKDLSGFGGLRLHVSCETPRQDTGVAVALQEADDSWHYVCWAADLTQTATVVDIPFSDFQVARWLAPRVHGLPADHVDENEFFDSHAVARIAFGCVNALGIGKVSFTITKVELLPAAAKPAAVTVQATGQFMNVNGSEFIPAGLFGDFPDGGGKHDMRLGSHRKIFSSYLPSNGKEHPFTKDPAVSVLINVVGGDRYQSSGRLTNPNWRKGYRNYGISTGRQLKSYYESGRDREQIFEWWNEPYLNWSNQTRKNFDPKFFDSSRAVEGGPVHLKVDGSIAPYLRWTKNPDVPPWLWTTKENWRRGRDEQGRIYKQSPPADVADGETYTVPIIKTVKIKEVDKATGKTVTRKVKKQEGERTLTAFTPWYVYDETQFTFWSGQSQLRHYIDPMLAFGRGLKLSYPEANYIVGWDFRASEDHWAGFKMLYQPTIDAGIDLIDGVTDHDYGGDVTRMPANYEVVTAYGVTTWGKWLYNYNTECGANDDPSANPAASKTLHAAGKKWLKCLWSARKIVHAAATVPDKARSFTFHWFAEDGEGVTFRALRNLRGRLVAIDSSDPKIYAVASVDGTDPKLPRPDYMSAGKEYVIAIFNDHGSARELTVPITAPQGTTFKELIIRRPQADAEQGTVHLVEEKQQASGASASWQGSIPGKSLLVLTLPLDGEPPEQAQLSRRQFFADRILVDVNHKPATAKKSRRKPNTVPGHRLVVGIPSSQLDGAKRAHLRCVFEKLAADEGTVVVNGTAIPLPSAQTAENVCWIRDIPVDVSLLKEQNELVFQVAEGRAGYRLCMASIVLDKDIAP